MNRMALCAVALMLSVSTALAGGPATTVAKAAPAGLAVPKGAKTIKKTVPAPDGKRYIVVGDLGQELDLPPIRRVAALDLWLVLPGGKVVRLTKDKRGESAAWSHDGKSLAYIDRSSLYVATADGTKSRRLLKERMPKGKPDSEYDYDAYYGHVWSLDDKYLVAFHTSGATAQALVVDVKTGRVVYRGADEVYDVEWKKDGSLALWDSERTEKGAKVIETVPRSKFKGARKKGKK